MRHTAVIGIDGGGTHSRGVLLGLEGELLALESAGPANSLAVGAKAAGDALGLLISKMLAEATERGFTVVAGGYGLSGLDRPNDYEAFVELLTAAGAAHWPFTLVNDAYLALRAGTSDGVGLAAVSGTGCNTVGVDRQGQRERVGGLAYEFGDFGGADDLGVAALRAACRAEDGRGPTTALTGRLKRELSVLRLDELLDRCAPDAAQPLPMGSLAPALFAVAAEGDAVALDILRHAGRELGAAARLVAERLFSATEAFPLVLGGRVLVEGGCDAMRDALVAEIAGKFPLVQPSRLAVDPVLGAALLAVDRLVELKHAAAPTRWPNQAFATRASAALASRRAT